MSYTEFEDSSPLELAWRLWGERRRKNREALYLAWHTSMLLAPHVKATDRHSISMERLYWALRAGMLDEEELKAVGLGR